ncbi:hypothetical protein HYV86_04705 [Candidatus Woesearchaeota archaeon]|nr:hypothetical protein [Candidatus Woesearchaeota archaeon]
MIAPLLIAALAAPPSTHYSLRVGDQFSNYEANSALFRTTNELSYRLNLELGALGTDNFLTGRVALVGYQAFTSMWSEITSHEMAHVAQAQKHCDVSGGFALQDLKGLWNVAHNARYKANCPNDKDYHQMQIAGLVQDEVNAHELYINKREQWNIGDSVFFLFSQLDIIYVPTALHTRDRISPLTKHEGEKLDPQFHIDHLHERKINLRPEQYTTQVALTTIASLRTIESVVTLANYVITGDRSHQPLGIDVGITRITPPLFSLYPTVNGNYLETNTLLKIQGTNIQLTIGDDVDFSGKSKVDQTRIGIGVFDLTTGPVWCNPFVAINIDEERNVNGVAVLTDVGLEIAPTLQPFFRFKYTNNDVVENTIKDEKARSSIDFFLSGDY